MRLSLMFFNAESTGAAKDVYRHIFDVARAVDGTAVEAIWLPERHHHEFGGPFPEPAVLAAAVTARTEFVQVRAGSVVVPLHHPIRVAERWAMVDNIAGPGRVGLSLAAGWNPNDFWTDPDRFDRRYELLEAAIPELRRWWSGQSRPTDDGAAPVSGLSMFPRPATPELPLWMTASGSAQTWELASRCRTGVLTHLLGQSLDILSERIAVLRANGGQGLPVAVMLHTFVQDDSSAAVAAARPALIEYFGRSLDLEVSAAGGRTMSARHRENLLQNRVEHHLGGTALIGGSERVRTVVSQLAEAGVDEVACLIDFGLTASQQLSGIEALLSHWPSGQP